MRALVAALLLAGAPALAHSQEAGAPAPPPAQTAVIPLPPPPAVSGWAVDARGVLAKFGQRPTTASNFGVNPSDIPGPGLGGSVGAHIFPLRLGRVAFGVGGEMVVARRKRLPVDGAGEPIGAELTSRFFSFSPQVSANFGTRDGWSYISAGLGTGSFETFYSENVNPDRRVRIINYGGGARWFTTSHLAFTVDLRFYAVSPGLPEGSLVERPRGTLMLLSAGISVR